MRKHQTTTYSGWVPKHAAPSVLLQAFQDALADIGVDWKSERSPGHPRPDRLGHIAGVPVVVEVKAAPSTADVHHISRTSLSADRYRILVGGRLSRAVRDELRKADIGYYDARGHLRLMRAPLWIDAPALPAPGESRAAGDPLSSAGSLDVALGILDDPDVVGRLGVRGFAAEIGRSPALVSTTLRRLREDHLVTDKNAPAVPDLFGATLLHWNPSRIPLGGTPSAGLGRLNERLQLNLDNVGEPGWALGDAQAAALWGAPMVLGTDSPPDFYVPASRILSLAVASFERARYGEHTCTVALQPAPFVCRRRVDLSDRRDDAVFPVVRPVIAALDLASDPGRGRETLDAWSERLADDVNRVW